MPRKDSKNTETTSDAPKRRGWVAPLAPDAGIAGVAAFSRAGFSDPRLVLNWPDIAGRDVARLCMPLKLKSGVLSLKAEPASAVFLQYETRTLVERINTYLGRPVVSRLKFIQSPLARREAPPPPRPKIPDEVRPDDPVLGYCGPERLKETLLALARARYTRTIIKRY